MKRIIALSIVICLAYIGIANAERVVTHALKVSNTPISTLSLTSGTGVTTDSVYWRGNTGFASLLITENIAGGAGDVDIFTEYSFDGTNWYRPYISNMGGTITVEGNIATALGNATRYIVFTPRLSNYVRFTFDPDANSQITASIIYQEDD